MSTTTDDDDNDKPKSFVMSSNILNKNLDYKDPDGIIISINSDLNEDEKRKVILAIAKEGSFGYYKDTNRFEVTFKQLQSLLTLSSPPISVQVHVPPSQQIPEEYDEYNIKKENSSI